MDRRTFLVLGAAAVGLAGCTEESTPPAPPSGAPDNSTPSDPDAGRRLEVAASEVALIAAHRSAILDIPELAADLAPFLAQHEAHLARVAPDFVAPTASPSNSSAVSPAASPVVSPAASSSPTTSAPPEANASSVLGALVAAETAAQRQRATACDGADDPDLARDLCLIAASEAQHAAALTDLAARESAS